MKITSLLLIVTSLTFNIFNLSTAAAADSSFLAPPYLFTQGGEKIKVSWSYDKKPATVSAILNTANGTQELTVTNEDELFSAELPIANCGFGDDLSYQVTGMSKAEKIMPIPCPGESAAPVKFVFLADTQVDTKEGIKPAQQFADLAVKFGAQAVLLGGDLVQTGNKFNLWSGFFQAMQPILHQSVLVPAVGNHEYHGNKLVPNWNHFFQVEANKAFYTTNIGDTEIFVINSAFHDDPSLIETEKVWLENQLMLSGAHWRIVIFHHPPYSVGVANSPLYPKKEFQVVQRDFVPLFEKYKVDMVLNGHVHIFERSEHNGIQYIIAGPAAGRIGIFGGTNPYSIRAEKRRTMIELTASHSELTATSVDTNGETVDTVTLKK